jgi:hypothetical protein
VVIQLRRLVLAFDTLVIIYHWFGFCRSFYGSVQSFRVFFAVSYATYSSLFTTTHPKMHAFPLLRPPYFRRVSLTKRKPRLLDLTSSSSLRPTYSRPSYLRLLVARLLLSFPFLYTTVYSLNTQTERKEFKIYATEMIALGT